MKNKSFILLFLMSLITFFAFGCVEEEKPVIQINDYPVGIISCTLDKTTFNDKNDINITGKIKVLYYYDSEVEFSISSDMITLPETIIEGENEVVITYVEDDYVLSRKAIIIYETIAPKTTKDKIDDYLKELYENKIVSEDITFVESYLNVDIYFQSNNKEVLSNSGRFTAPILDVPFSIDVYYYIDGVDVEYSINMIAKGYGDVIDATFAYLNDIVPSKVYENFSLPLVVSEYGATVSWSLADEICINGLIVVDKKELDYIMNITCKVTCNEISREKVYCVNCISHTDLEKVTIILNEQISYFAENEINSNIDLQTKETKYGCRLVWRSYNTDILYNDGTFIQPLDDITIIVRLTVYLGTDSDTRFINMRVQGEKYMDTWEKVESFLNRIYKSEIKTQSFNLYGCEEGYLTVKTKNIGYLPFYTTTEVKVTEDILPDDSPLKANMARVSTNYITLHNTGMAAPTATAEGLNEYIHTTDRIASWHFSIDDKEAYQELKLGEVGWHAGDGSTTYGQTWYNNGVLCLGGGNRNSIGIEMCVYSGCDFNWVMRNTAKLVSKLLVTYNLTPACIRQHYDFSGKNCPQVIREADRWSEMLELISLEYFARTELNGVEFVWKSLTPDVMDDTGTVIKNEGENTKINYEVTVTYNNESKKYSFETVLLKATA